MSKMYWKKRYMKSYATADESESAIPPTGKFDKRTAFKIALTNAKEVIE